MESEGLVNIYLFGQKIDITSIIVQWGIILIIAIVAFILTRNLKKIPNKKQSTVELFVVLIQNLVESNMGKNSKKFVPYIGTLVLFLLISNLTNLIGIKPPTEDYSVALGLAAISFFVIQANAIKSHGLLGYFGGYGKPYLFLLPINIMERIVLPISLSLRLFGNMTAGGVMIAMVYGALGKFAIGIPVPVHFYFDLFDGTLQMVIFVMLTMINIKIIAEH